MTYLGPPILYQLHQNYQNMFANVLITLKWILSRIIFSKTAEFGFGWWDLFCKFFNVLIKYHFEYFKNEWEYMKSLKVGFVIGIIFLENGNNGCNFKFIRKDFFETHLLIQLVTGINIFSLTTFNIFAGISPLEFFV